MKVFTETGTLIYGVEYDGVIHKDFELAEQLVADGIAVLEDPLIGPRAGKSDYFFNVAVTARRLRKLGAIPKEAITHELIMGMLQQDFNQISKADARLAARRATFRGGDAPAADDGAGAEEAGVRPGGD